ncbi:MAG: penicillin-binding transpeptidase domain-containing protein [Lachnospiraceae bacterium]|nr:penicillin-binding transpeptidase domain-containing protein [Lachnospiraceae bacterium]
MFRKSRKRLKQVADSRVTIVGGALLLLAISLGIHLFKLQIVKGGQYQRDFALRIKKTEEITAARGNIYDRNHKALAYNELIHSVSIEDSGTYRTQIEKNLTINKSIITLIGHLSKNQDRLSVSFPLTVNDQGQPEYTVSGVAKQRFLADIFGVIDPKDMKAEQSSMTAADLLKLITGSQKFGIRAEDYSASQLGQKLIAELKYPQNLDIATQLQVAAVRFEMSKNSFQKYLANTIATEISDKSMIALTEDADNLPGISVIDQYKRIYPYGEALSNIVGYIGKPSETELAELKGKSGDHAYTASDVVGKMGIEKTMENHLRGSNGEKEFFVNNVGVAQETKITKEAVIGNDVILTIDADLMKKTYELLKSRIAGQLLEQLVDDLHYKFSGEDLLKIKISIAEVYGALFKNGVLDIRHFSAKDAGSSEQHLYEQFTARQTQLLSQLEEIFSSDQAAAYPAQDETTRKYLTYLFFTKLVSDGILTVDDTSAPSYQTLVNGGDIKINKFLLDAISKNWIQTKYIMKDDGYADSDKVIAGLVAYLKEALPKDIVFSGMIYDDLIRNEYVSPVHACLALYEQGVLPKNDELTNALSSGVITPYGFMRDRIRALEITPGQLGIDPSTGSAVLSDPNNGEVIVAASYPGYDNNRLVNRVDSKYYERLLLDATAPMVDKCTNELLAPGSTFKMLSTIAGYEEGVMSPDELINCQGEFKQISPSPKCWLVTGHGDMDMVHALRHSCDIYFYTLGYRLGGGENGRFDDQASLDRLNKYCTLLGMDETTGIELPETKPHMSSTQGVQSAIGQGSYSFTTTQLARYAGVLATSGEVTQFHLLKKVVDGKDPNHTLVEYQHTNEQISLPENLWQIVKSGMSESSEYSQAFKGSSISSPSKTGTVEEENNRAPHAAFIGYAPAEAPQVSYAVRLTHGLSNTQAGRVARDMVSIYLGEKKSDEIKTDSATVE